MSTILTCHSVTEFLPNDGLSSDDKGHGRGSKVTASKAIFHFPTGNQKGKQGRKPPSGHLGRLIIEVRQHIAGTPGRLHGWGMEKSQLDD